MPSNVITIYLPTALFLIAAVAEVNVSAVFVAKSDALNLSIKLPNLVLMVLPAFFKPSPTGFKISSACFANLLFNPFIVVPLMIFKPLDAPQATAQPSNNPSDTTLKPLITFFITSGVCSFNRASSKACVCSL